MNDNEIRLPRLDKTVLEVKQSCDDLDDKAYWLKCSAQERLQHVEVLRRINYGDAAAARLQRVLEVVTR